MRTVSCFILVLCVSLLASGCGDTSDELSVDSDVHENLLEVEVASVARGSLSATLELVGNLLPSRRSVVVAEVDGVILAMPKPTTEPVVVEYAGLRETLPLGIGSDVRQGDVLITLDASDYERGVKVAEANLEKAKRDLEDLMAWERPEEIRRLEALAEEVTAIKEYSELEFKRSTTLLSENAVSRSDHEENEADLRKARALFAHAQAKLDIAKAGPTKEDIAVAKAAVVSEEAEVEHKRWKVERCTITAPYDAVITDQYMDEGDRVTAFPRVEILEIMDVRFLVAEVGVPEQFGDKIKLLDKAVVRVKGKSDEIPGVIVRINEKIDPANRTFRIRVAIDNTTRRFRVGQFIRVLLNIGTSPETLTIPRRAITYSGGQPRVFVYSEGSVSLRTIQLGVDSEHTVEVVAGVTEDEKVVVRDPAVLSDGMKVKLKPVPQMAESFSRSNQ